MDGVARPCWFPAFILFFFFFFTCSYYAGRFVRHLPFRQIVVFRAICTVLLMQLCCVFHPFLFILYNGGCFMFSAFPSLDLLYRSLPEPVPSTHVADSGRTHGGLGGTFLSPDNPFSGYRSPILQDLGVLYEQFEDLLSGLDDDDDNDNPLPYYPSPSARQIDYLYADLAKHYGMNKETAYNEAMANTAYQRAVADMQMAGLNPASLFSAGRASTAGSGYASGSGGSYSSARGASDGDKLPGWLYYGVTALVQAIGTGVTKNAYTGFAASQIAQNFMKAINGGKGG